MGGRNWKETKEVFSPCWESNYKCGNWGAGSLTMCPETGVFENCVSTHLSVAHQLLVGVRSTTLGVHMKSPRLQEASPWLLDEYRLNPWPDT